VLRLRQNLDAALEHVRVTLRAAQAGGLPGLALRCRVDAAKLLYYQGKLGALLESCAELLPPLRAVDDNYTIGQLYGMMALSYLLRGKLPAALEASEQAYAIRSSIGDIHGIGTAANQRAHVLVTIGRLGEARDLIDRTLAMYEAAGEMNEVGFTLEQLAVLQLLEGEVDLARLTLARALALLPADGDAKLRGDLNNSLGVALLMVGDLDGAQRQVSGACSGGGVWVEMDRRLILGLLALGRGDASAARAAADTLAAQASKLGVGLFLRRAAQLAGAASEPPPYDWPRLLWVAAADEPAAFMVPASSE